jgi:hypothetical protein
MSRLVVTILSATPAPHTAAPAILFRLRIEEILGGRVHALALRCQTRIEPRGRRYAKDEQARLYELFGDVSQWERSLRSVTWAHTAILVPSFERTVEVDLPVACSYDLEIASAKYLHAIRDGDIPLGFFFSGTMFGPGENGLSIEPVAWDVDASYRLPASVWQAAMDQFFPGGGWLRVSRDTIDRLQAFRGSQAVVNWDEALDRLLRHADVELPV